MLLDLGQGSFSETWRHGSFNDISAVLISHLHADHNVDLIPLRHWSRYQNHGYAPALYSPTELRGRIGLFQTDAEFLADFAGEALAARTFAVGDLLIQAAPVTHIPDSWAFRLAATADPDAPGLVYSGDCGRADDLLPLMRAGDTLLCEAGFGLGEPTNPAGIHLTAGEAARVAREGDTARLIVTHVLDSEDHARVLSVAEESAGREVRVAEPGLELDIR